MFVPEEHLYAVIMDLGTKIVLLMRKHTNVLQETCSSALSKKYFFFCLSHNTFSLRSFKILTSILTRVCLTLTHTYLENPP